MPSTKSVQTALSPVDRRPDQDPWPKAGILLGKPNGTRFHRHRETLFVLTLVLVSFGIYANTLGAGFSFDDQVYTVPNPKIRSLEHLPELLNIFGSGGTSYRPVRNLTLFLDHAVWGLNPFGFHLTNCLLHCLCTLLVYRVLRQVLQTRLLGGLSALLFALHPIHTESVANISGRKDILATIFFLLGWELFLGCRRGRWRSALATPLIWACVLLSFFSKEIGITLPASFFLWDLLQPASTSLKASESPRSTRVLRELLARTANVFRRYWKFYLPFIAVQLSAVIYLVFVHPPSQQKYWGGSIWTNLLTSGRIHVLYLKQLLAPVTLIGDYSFNAFPPTADPTDPWALICLAFTVSLVLGLILAFRKAPLVSFLGLLYFLTLLPVSQIKPHHEIAAERFLYLPSIGFVAILAMGWGKLFSNLRVSRLAVGFLVPLLLFYGYRTYTRNLDWKDDLTFWRATVRDAPDCARARRNLAYNLFKRGKQTEAIREMYACLAIQPSSAQSHYNLGYMHARMGRRREAIEHYNQALRDRMVGPSARLNLGLIHLYEGRDEEAESCFRELIKVDRQMGQAYYNLGVLRQKQGKEQEARILFKKAREVRSPFPARSTGST